MLTGLTIMCSGALTGQPDLTGAKLSMFAFSSVLGDAGTMILAVGLALFSYSTVLGWYWYGETAAVYLFGQGVIPVMKILWIILVVVGGWGGAEILTSLWDLADTLNGLMAIPNLIGLLVLSGVTRKLVKDFDEKRKAGILK